MSAPDPLGRGPELTIAERPRSVVSLAPRRGRAQALAEAVRHGFGLDLPGPGRFTTGEAVNATAIQPAVWLLDGAPEAPGALHARVAEAAGGLAAVVDQSHGRSLLRLTGTAARAVLATCCRLDLHPRAFPPGAAATTLLAHVSCTVRGFAGGFELLVGSTYAAWLIEELVEASAAHGALLVPAPAPHRSAMPAAEHAR